ncbi:helix-turn-helix transcriptional regulator [Magnetospirillum molischianum]|uniref:Phage transcriptional regulator, AlpA n=1 Tax=Magnetospirillum molischianum DSM 120 TaxID=1150626 RepID=H8FP21_MAGML|nr:AlpA family transcriptional regulator [Magnetospirillum molischianum]CCG40109.1 Phage transcriptional regulator, AlpA [Magnetospirillum molischianum DSM 120]
MIDVVPDERFLRLPEVLSKVGLSRATVYAKIKDGDFPAPLRLFGGPYVAWKQTDVLNWMGRQIERQGGG